MMMMMMIKIYSRSCCIDQEDRKRDDDDDDERNHMFQWLYLSGCTLSLWSSPPSPDPSDSSDITGSNRAEKIRHDKSAFVHKILKLKVKLKLSLLTSLRVFILKKNSFLGGNASFF